MPPLFPDVPHRSISERRAMLEEAALVDNRRASRGIEEASALIISRFADKLDDRLERTVLVLNDVHSYLPNMLGFIKAVSFKRVATTGRPPAFPLSGLCSISSQPATDVSFELPWFEAEHFTQSYSMLASLRPPLRTCTNLRSASFKTPRPSFPLSLLEVQRMHGVLARPPTHRGTSRPCSCQDRFPVYLSS